MSQRYIGRFAPSPTGPLHLGSITTALASYLDARHNHGTWLVRMEDLDPPRESPTAPAEILHQLNALGLIHDGEVLYQSTRLTAYESALASLAASGSTFYCNCARKNLPDIYPGTCHLRTAPPEDGEPCAIRFRVGEGRIAISDRLTGNQSWDLQTMVGDFIIRRKDGLTAYQLAVVVDDIYQGVTHVVRGNDLLDSTPRQISLYHALNADVPEYLHLPILVDQAGDKLSKQAHADPVSVSQPMSVLRYALDKLGQPTWEDCANITELLQTASHGWKAANIPAAGTIKQ